MMCGRRRRSGFRWLGLVGDSGCADLVVAEGAGGWGGHVEDVLVEGGGPAGSGQWWWGRRVG